MTLISNFPIEKVLNATRSKDWMKSFVPFVMGCVYLWLWWFGFSISDDVVLVVLLSLITSIGFASLGYFINEFFDIKSDAKAGKINKLALVPIYARVGILVIVLTLTFFPWIWLPKNQLSFILIGSQLLLFLLYSMPFPRLKESIYFSLVLDAFYAYSVPLLLSFHTFSLLAGSKTYPVWFYLFFLAVTFIGLRNILTHQIRDVFKDAVSGQKSLPMVLGLNRTILLIKLLFIYEVFLISMTLIFLLISNFIAFLLLIGYILFAVFEYKIQGKKVSPTLMFEDVNRVYNVFFPWLMLLVLCYDSPFGWIILIIHSIILVPSYLWKGFVSGLKKAWFISFRFIMKDIRHWASYTINFPIYLVFRMVGVNLRREGISAWEFLLRKMGVK